MKSLKSLLTLTSLALAVSGSALATNTSVLPTKESVLTNSKSINNYIHISFNSKLISLLNYFPNSFEFIDSFYFIIFSNK